MKLSLTNLQRIKFLRNIQALAKAKKVILYLVGGALRDCLLAQDRQNLDFDFCLKARSLQFAKALSGHLKAPFVLLDEPHGCARVVYKHNNLEVNLDFSDFRANAIKADLGKRDFTINSLAIKLEDLFSKNPKVLIIDPYQARNDLKRRMLRLVNKDAFRDDPVRMLRAFSIAGRLGFKIDQDTLIKIAKQVRLIKHSAGERIREEILKLLSVPNAYPYLLLMVKSGLLQEIIPEIRPMYKMKQGSYHHLDVWAHTLETFKQLEAIINTSLRSAHLKTYLSQNISSGHKRLALLKFICLLHDIGKPTTLIHDGKKIHFYGHERVGAKIAGDIAIRLRFSSKEKGELKNVIYAHLRPGHLADLEDLSQRAIFRFFRDCQEEAVAVALLSLADQRATRGTLQSDQQRQRHEKLIRFFVQKYFKKLKEKKEEPLINGHELMNRLKLKPGPLIGQILNEVREAQAEASVQTKEQALQWAYKFYRQIKAARDL